MLAMDTKLPDGPKWGMALDLERCIGCHACSVACKVENSVSLGHFRTKVYYYDYAATNPHNHQPTMKRAFLPTLCMQCEDAPCLDACPNDAIVRGADGIVRIVESECDRSRDCIKACPYGALHIDPVAQIADKCDFCSHRLDAGMEPACVEVRPAASTPSTKSTARSCRCSSRKRRPSRWCITVASAAWCRARWNIKSPRATATIRNPTRSTPGPN